MQTVVVGLIPSHSKDLYMREWFTFDHNDSAVPFTQEATIFTSEEHSTSTKQYSKINKAKINKGLLQPRFLFTVPIWY